MKRNDHGSGALLSMAGALKLLGDPNRLRILSSLTRKCHSVSYIMRSTGLTQTNVSFHLAKLRNAGLVLVQPRGPFKYY